MLSWFFESGADILRRFLLEMFYAVLMDIIMLDINRVQTARA